MVTRIIAMIMSLLNNAMSIKMQVIKNTIREKIVTYRMAFVRMVGLVHART